jgi:hypothetical protein
VIWPDALATLVGAVIAFAFGAAYYGALSGAWMRAARIAPEESRMSPGLLALAFALVILVSGGAGWFLATVGIVNSVPSAVAVTAIAWLVFVAAPMAVNHRYQGLPWRLTAIDSGHWLGVLLIASLTHVVMGGAPKFGDG